MWIIFNYNSLKLHVVILPIFTIDFLSSFSVHVSCMFKRFQLMWGEMIETQDAAGGTQDAAPSLPHLDSPVQSDWPWFKLHFSDLHHITYQFQMVTTGRDISDPKWIIVSKNQGIQTACLDRSGLLSPLLLSVLSTLSYLSIWQDPGGWSTNLLPFAGQSPAPSSCDLFPECSHDTFQNFTRSSHGFTCNNRPLSGL